MTNTSLNPIGRIKIFYFEDLFLQKSFRDQPLRLITLYIFFVCLFTDDMGMHFMSKETRIAHQNGNMDAEYSGNEQRPNSAKNGTRYGSHAHFISSATPQRKAETRRRRPPPWKQFVYPSKSKSPQSGHFDNIKPVLKSHVICWHAHTFWKVNAR